tara:strand:- start:224 stop:1300 length:1077 start_codon:yes stop_codon:yes gene_type:complete
MINLAQFKPNLIPNNPKDDSFDRNKTITKNGGHKMYVATRKKDGCRLQLLNKQVLSRSLKAPGSELVVSRFQHLADECARLNIALDGEFYKHGLKFNAIFRFFSKGDVTTPKYRAELEKALAKDPKKFAKDYDGHTIDFLTTFHDDLQFWLFDGIVLDAPGLTRYQDRMIEIKHRLTQAGLMQDNFLIFPKFLKFDDEEQLEELYEDALEFGWEGLVLTHVGHEYKFGRNSLNQGTILKLKDDAIEYDGVVIDVVQATSIKDGVETTVNELGRSVTSKKIADREDSGIAKGLVVAFCKEDGTCIGIFTVGLKGFNHQERKEMFNNRGQYIGKHFTYTGMNPVKDFPRHAYFSHWRDEK